MLGAEDFGPHPRKMFHLSGTVCAVGAGTGTGVGGVVIVGASGGDGAGVGVGVGAGGCRVMALDGRLFVSVVFLKRDEHRSFVSKASTLKHLKTLTWGSMGGR